MKILVFGLPGAGKTTVAKAIARGLGAVHINASNVRTIHDDWDMTPAGRLRQCHRMKLLSESGKGTSVIDFICPLQEHRDIFDADITVWVNTRKKGRFPTTNRMFEAPTSVDYTIPDYNSIEPIVAEIIEACQAVKMARSYHDAALP